MASDAGEPASPRARRRLPTATALMAAALLLSACVLGASWMLVDALRESALAVHRTGQELQAGAAVARRGPDPDEVHRIDTRGAPWRGKAHAKVTVVEFADFECPFCRKAAPMLDRLHDEYGDRVRFVFKHLPLPGHPEAPLAHAAAEAAFRQEHFWEMREHLFRSGQPLTPESLLRAAEDMGLDVARFRSDADSEPARQRIVQDMQEARELGVTGTPSYFVNGRYVGSGSYEALSARIDAELGR